MQRFIIFLIMSLVALSAALCISLSRCIRERNEKERLASNQESLLTEMRTYKVRDSLNASSVDLLTLRSSELERYFASTVSLLRNIDIKIKRTESVSVNALESNYRIQTPLRDTVILSACDSSSISFPAQAISMHTPYISLDGIIARSEFTGTFTTCDTLTQVVHRIPRRFLFFRWGTRQLRQEIISSNPHTRITYSRYIKVVK